MPERHFDIQWPNGKEESCYSPSSIINDYLSAGESYPLKDFVQLAELSLNEASERVRAKYGYSCSSAMDQLYKIKQSSMQFEHEFDPLVIVKRIY
jgi:uncharacterized repeat protein (TIGR04042 family)